MVTDLQIYAIASAIPDRMRIVKGGGGPWHISEGVLRDYNAASDTGHKAEDLERPEVGRAVAIWHLQRIRRDLMAESKDPSPFDVVMGYLAGWNNPPRERVAFWTPVAKAIVADAAVPEPLAPESDAPEIPLEPIPRPVRRAGVSRGNTLGWGLWMVASLASIGALALSKRRP